jgi:hypothetical protein
VIQKSLTEATLKNEGLKVLTERFGLVGTEHFIALMNRETCRLYGMATCLVGWKIGSQDNYKKCMFLAMPAAFDALNLMPRLWADYFSSYGR